MAKTSEITRPSKYPTQYEAELVLDTKLALDSIHTGYAHDSVTAQKVKRWSQELQADWHRVFQSPAASPWEIKMVRGKPQVEWRGDWDE